MAMTARPPFHGEFRKLVVAIDVGTTYSGVSYSILDPGEVPKTLGVRRYPGQEGKAGDSKIPSILYYDKYGAVQAAGAEALLPSILDKAEDEEWVKVEWFKLHLRPTNMPRKDSEAKYNRMTDLPHGKTIVDVFADFLRYLYSCTKQYIIETHASGDLLWDSLEDQIDFVLSHPNGWGGAQQAQMRSAATQAGLVRDTHDGQARIQFVTEGEASVHFCISNGLASDAMKDQETIMVVDAGGGTVDISTYTVKMDVGLTMEEIAVPECIFQGSAIVSFRAREYLTDKLASSRYANDQDVAEMFKEFDRSTKLVFRNKEEASYIKFGSMRDREPQYHIRNGQIMLTGDEVASLFEPSISGIKQAICKQSLAAEQPISSIFLVGGFAASPWLFSELKDCADELGMRFSRPDTHTHKAVAEGGVSFYLDHFVSVRVARFTYGAKCLTGFQSSKSEHKRRSHRLMTRPSGRKFLPNGFAVILQEGTRVSEETEFYRELNIESYDPLSYLFTDIACYKGKFKNPQWTDTEPGMFTTLCNITGDISDIPMVPKKGPLGAYYSQSFDVVLSFGLTELKAQLRWFDNGIEKRCPASTVFDDEVAVM
ncbi:hypothetical protein CERSUDRAFT_98705 [Gelatoporia subvermispora B]|uniref:Uncharacterized protein n=1 Tax=Ceriporiopsis subvermispora (strain B) TaxID=914234 RepID=M2R4G0_CERS8|nr:hypothetical protein CERSUDRAFT_98705 [Gelatoporia subvermispora B]